MRKILLAFAALGLMMAFSSKEAIQREWEQRAAWNYLLIQNDGSKGIHDPTYVRQVLLATPKALQ
jgi:predicted membrane chloride channel (bestrophin family)